MNKKHYDNIKLAEMREKIGKQKDVAERIGVSPVQLSRAENGKSASFELLSAVAGLANADVRDILKPSEKNLSVT